MNLTSLLSLPFFWYICWATAVPLCLTIFPPEPYRKYVSCIILFSILIKAEFFFKIDPSQDNVSIPLTLQGVLFNLFFYTFNLFFVVEYPDLTDYRPGTETLDYVRALKPCTWEKFKWSVQRSILVTLVGHGWNWQISKPFGTPQLSNSEWLLHFIFVKLLLKYTTFDILFHLYLSTDYIKTRGWGPDNLQDLIFLHPNSKLSVLHQLVLAFASVYCIYFGIETLYDIAKFLNVFIFRTANLNDYPLLFGTFQNDFTIKSLWGNVWHKLMYQLSVPQSKYLAGCDYKSKHYNRKPRYGLEKWRKYLMYLLVFTFTGMFHACGTLNMPWAHGAGYNINIPFHDYLIKHLPEFMTKCFYSFIFFPAQFVLIVMETGASWLFRKITNNRVRLSRTTRMLIGMIWISLSEITLLQLYIDELVKSGFNVAELASPLTPVHQIWKILEEFKS